MFRVLVIEDNAQNLGLIRYLLRAAGFESFEARDGREGIRTALDTHPDLILMDLQMPVLDGYEALAQIRACPDIADTRVVAVTAYSMSGDERQALDAGFDGYLSKPLDPFTFCDSVREFLTAT